MIKVQIFTILFFSTLLVAQNHKLKNFLKKNQIPIYNSLDKSKIPHLSLLLKRIKLKKSNKIHVKKLCFFAINLFYATKNKKIFSIVNYRKMKNSNTIQSKIFKCILSDIYFDNHTNASYILNTNVSYNLDILKKNIRPAKVNSIIPAHTLAKTISQTTDGFQKGAKTSELIERNAQTIVANDPIAKELISGVVHKDQAKLGGALLFIGLREGLTKEQKKAIAHNMTELATQLNLKPVKTAVKAYLDSNVRVYVNNGNNFLVNYKLEF